MLTAAQHQVPTGLLSLVRCWLPIFHPYGMKPKLLFNHYFLTVSRRDIISVNDIASMLRGLVETQHRMVRVVATMLTTAQHHVPTGLLSLVRYWLPIFHPYGMKSDLLFNPCFLTMSRRSTILVSNMTKSKLWNRRRRKAAGQGNRHQKMKCSHSKNEQRITTV